MEEDTHKFDTIYFSITPNKELVNIEIITKVPKDLFTIRAF
jgi:hypothetical protein